MGVRSLYEFFKGEEKEVWIQNTSSPQGNITITIDPETHESITIPKGPDPIPLTERFTFDKLKKCSELRLLVEEKKFLVLLTQEEADVYYKSQGKDRYDRVQKRKKVLENKVMDVIEKQKEKSVVDNIMGEGVIKATESPIPPKVLSLEAEYANKIINDEKYVDELMLIESDLLNDEVISFLQAKTRQSKIVKTYVNSLMKKTEKK